MISQMLQLEQQIFTFIGQKNHLKGEFYFTGIVKIAGIVEGPIHILEGGSLTIERTGKVEGTINCFDIEIFGTFKGHLESEGKVVIWPSAEISGPVRASSLVIYPGAILNIEGHTNEQKNASTFL